MIFLKIFPWNQKVVISKQEIFSCNNDERNSMQEMWEIPDKLKVINYTKS